MIAHRYAPEPDPYTPPSVFSRPRTNRLKRLNADRFRRVWRVAQDIAEAPGWSRAELADKYHLSERQTQADLLIIRDLLGLPLVRSNGYRFASEGYAAGPSALTVRDIQIYVLSTAARWKASRGPARETAREALDRLPLVCPPHLAPLAGRMVEAVSGSGGHTDAAFLALADAMLSATTVKLTFLYGQGPSGDAERVVTPELLVRVLANWYVIGPCLQAPYEAARMYRVDRVAAVTAMAVEDRGRAL